MKKFYKNLKFVRAVSVLSFAFGFIAPVSVLAATTPSLGRRQAMVF